ncbi:MAG: class I tRNA ligase family protein, partial [Clostridiales Family XIII bacterium]|nr:class I tRNA ligase family protein [Clostridiales Family XIII bacterium]
STLGWPEKTPDLDYFYPTNVLVTGYDIIFFWVVRMVFSSLNIMGEVPFEHVFVHGLVRDEQGRKMSKSLGNGVDPLLMIDKYGADALRFMLLNGSAAGSDMRFTEDKLESSRNFANKLWNASRFVIMNFPEDEDGNLLDASESAIAALAKAGKLQAEDIWVIDNLKSYAADITRNLEGFELSLASSKIYELTREIYCDWYIELVKARLYDGSDVDKKVVCTVLKYVLKDILRLLHPFMPFITEEIWSKIGSTGKLIVNTWPVLESPVANLADRERNVQSIELAMDAIRAVRSVRVDYDAAPSKKLSLYAKSDEQVIDRLAMLESTQAHIKKLANVEAFGIITDVSALGDSASAIVNGLELLIPMGDLVDVEAEREKLIKEKTKLEGEIKRISGKLSNQGFVSKAPEKVVAAEREKQAAYEENLVKVEARLVELI